MGTETNSIARTLVRWPGSQLVPGRALGISVRGMADEFVRVERRDDGVALVRLDRPKMNALSVELLRQLTAAAESLSDEPPGAVVVWGGERIFAAGAEISEFRGTAKAEAVGGAFREAL